MVSIFWHIKCKVRTSAPFDTEQATQCQQTCSASCYRPIHIACLLNQVNFLWTPQCFFSTRIPCATVRAWTHDSTTCQVTKELCWNMNVWYSIPSFRARWDHLLSLGLGHCHNHIAFIWGVEGSGNRWIFSVHLLSYTLLIHAWGLLLGLPSVKPGISNW